MDYLHSWKNRNRAGGQQTGCAYQTLKSYLESRNASDVRSVVLLTVYPEGNITFQRDKIMTALVTVGENQQCDFPFQTLHWKLKSGETFLGKEATWISILIHFGFMFSFNRNICTSFEH